MTRGLETCAPLRAALLAAALLAPAGTRAHPAAPSAAQVLPAPQERARVLDVNRLALHVSNTGPFAFDIMNGHVAGLEYPRGSGLRLAFAAGPWLVGIGGSDTLTAISEFTWEFSPGPATDGAATLDTLAHAVYRTARADTLGRAAWLARGAGLGAPLDSQGEPLLRGDLHFWTLFTDAPGPWTAFDARFGSGPPIGVDVALSAYAFDRTGFISEVAFLEYALVHRGTVTLDSAWFGVFLDPLTSHESLPRVTYDTALDLAVAYRATSADGVYGAAGPALGLVWLRGPRPTGGAPLRPTSYAAWANGIDPRNVHEYLGAMRSVRPFSGPIIDPTTNQPSAFWSTGDPVTGSGWVDSTIQHPHTVLAAGPFRFAPGDTQHVAVALVVARAASRLESVALLRTRVAATAAAWAEDFVNLPPWRPAPPPPATRGRAWPNPATSSAAIGWRAMPGEPLQLEVLDARGRRVRSWRTVAVQGPEGFTSWDLCDDDGGRVPPGLYFARVTGPGFRHAVRVVVLE